MFNSENIQDVLGLKVNVVGHDYCGFNPYLFFFFQIFRAVHHNLGGLVVLKYGLSFKRGRGQ